MRRKTVCIAAVVVLLCVAVPAFSQAKPMTNDDVVKMVKAELGDEIIIKTIRGSATAFDSSPDALAQLRAAGVSQPVLEAIVEASRKETSSNTAASPSTHAPTPPPAEFAKGTKETRSGPLIYVEEVSSSGGIMASSDTTIEAIKTLQEHGMRVTTIKEKADYVLQVTRQLGKKRWSKDTKIALSNKNGEVVLAKSTRSVGGAMGEVVDFVKTRSE